MDEKCGVLLAAINSSKRSILYDLEKKMEGMKSAMLANRTIETLTEEMTSNKEELGVILPVKTFQDFLSFEETIAASEEKRKILVSLALNIALSKHKKNINVYAQCNYFVFIGQFLPHVTVWRNVHKKKREESDDSNSLESRGNAIFSCWTTDPWRWKEGF